MDKRTRSYTCKRVQSKEPLTFCFHYLQHVVYLLLQHLNPPRGISFTALPPGAFYASTWPGVNRRFRNRCSTTLKILVFTRENSTKESVNTFLPDWQTRLLHLHWIRPNGHLSSIWCVKIDKSLCFVSVNYEWIVDVYGNSYFYEYAWKREKENETQVEISLARYRDYTLYILHTFACILQISCCLSLRKWKLFFSTLHWYKSKYKDFFASTELQDEERDS